MLDSLESSVLGDADMRRGRVNGTKAMVVEAIKTVRSVDWVTKAGAGGRALEIIESEDGGESMDEEVVETMLGPGAEDTPPVEDVVVADGEVQEMLIAEAVAEAVDEASLPDVFKDALKASEYADETVLAEAIKKAVEGYKAAVGSGKPFGQGQPKKKAIAEVEETSMERRIKRHKRILAEVGYSS